MRAIRIDQFQAPFSLLPGTCTPILGSAWGVRVFPTLLQFFPLDKTSALGGDVGSRGTQREKAPYELALTLTGPVRSFMVTQDIQRGKIRIQGHFVEGYVVMELMGSEEQLCVQLKRGPQKGVAMRIWQSQEFFSPLKQEEISLQVKQSHTIDLLKASTSPLLSSPFPASVKDQAHKKKKASLFLGVSKKQQMEKIWERRDIKEFLPLWFALSQRTPMREGLMAPSLWEEELPFSPLVRKCQDVIQGKKREEIASSLLSLCLAAFFSLLMPRAFDWAYQGISNGGVPNPEIPLERCLLRLGYEMTLSLFCSYEERSNSEKTTKEGLLHLLPALPPECHCGKLIDLPLGDTSEVPLEVSLEWSKKKIRRVLVRALEERTLRIKIGSKRAPEKKMSVRVKKNNQKRGERFTLEEAFRLEKGALYHFDQFLEE